MLKKWGAENFGLFALASSLLVSMALLDGGVRALTRIRMAEAWAQGDEKAARDIYSEGILTFSSICLLAFVISVLVAALGWLDQWLHLPPGGARVLVLTVFCTAILMITLLALEPLAAKGALSILKASNTWGALIAIPICGILVWASASVEQVIIAYAACLTIPNLIVFWRSGLLALTPRHGSSCFGPRVALRTLRGGMWYYITTVSLVSKTHLLTFIVSAMRGPAEAGLFYMFLRISEVIGNVGATASETSLAALASVSEIKRRRELFQQSWLYISIFCIHGALVLIFLFEPLFKMWLSGHVQLSSGIGTALACFGLSGALSRVLINASMGLNIARDAALMGFAEAALSLGLATAGLYLGGQTGLFFGGSLGIITLIPIARKVSILCGWPSPLLWMTTLKPLFLGFLMALVLLIIVRLSHRAVLWIGVFFPLGGIALWQIKKIHKSIAMSPNVAAHPLK